MSHGTFFVRSCPSCGRHLEIRVELLGREVRCLHCGRQFMAHEHSIENQELRVEEALAKAQRLIDSVRAFNSTTSQSG